MSKIIIDKETKEVKYILDDDEKFNMGADVTVFIGRGAGGCNIIARYIGTNTHELIEGVALPSGTDKSKHGNKYCYKNNEFATNPKYEDDQRD